MIPDRDLVSLRPKDSPYQYVAQTREAADRYLAMRANWPSAMREGELEMVPVPSCRCCGEPAQPNLRCVKHQGRAPCAAEGCRRTRAGHVMSICGEHWRLYVPPGSPQRRAILRLRRMAKKSGYKLNDHWGDALEHRYWQLWNGIIRRVRRLSTEGAIDEAEINKLFGWDA